MALAASVRRVVKPPSEIDACINHVWHGDLARCGRAGRREGNAFYYGVCVLYASSGQRREASRLAPNRFSMRWRGGATSTLT